MTIPKIQDIPSLRLPEAELHQGPKGIPVYDLRLGTQDVLRLELIFEAGRWWEAKPALSRSCAKMVKAGAAGLKAEALSEAFEFYGAKLKVVESFDTLSVELYCLKKHFRALLPLVMSVVTEASFPADEWRKFVRRSKQQLKMQLQKNEVQAYRHFTEALFGETHPYGYNSRAEDYEALSLEDLRNHYRRCFVAWGCRVLIAGRTDAQVLGQLFEALERLPEGSALTARPITEPQTLIGALHKASPSKHNMQASLRLGFIGPERRHPDFADFTILSAVLGGFFGARLMQNLREDKGYTYGIYASVETMRHAAYFCISTEVGLDVKEAALEEIYRELARLQEELVPETEWAMVRQYLLGSYLTALDGPFAVAGVWSELLRADLHPQYFEQMIEATQHIEVAKLQDLAQRYFDKARFTEVIVG